MRSSITILSIVVVIVYGDILECDYFDTVSLSNSKRLSNGTYQYENVIIPPELIGIYDYEILEDGERVTVPAHLRGCACKLTKCIRFCCHPNQLLLPDERSCTGDISKELNFDPYMNITLNNGSETLLNIRQYFVLQMGLPVPCATHSHLDRDSTDEENWTLYENGSFLRHFDMKFLSKREYCFQPHAFRNGFTENTDLVDSSYVLVPHNCNEAAAVTWGINILRGLSIISLILTIIVYLSLAKLRNLHGYCLVSYMLSLMIAYGLILADNLRGHWSQILCQVNGYVGYYFVMASFLWLTVISFNLWNSFRAGHYNTQRYRPMRRFLAYSLWGWGVASLLTATVIAVDLSLSPDNENDIQWMPGVALYNCWVKTHDWSALLYFHGLMALQIIFNIVMFLLTVSIRRLYSTLIEHIWEDIIIDSEKAGLKNLTEAIRIVEVQRELKNIAIHGEHEQHLNSEKQNYALFMRLFVIMGVTWTFEIIGYLVQDNEALVNVFVAFDYINSAHGIIIFVMFVLKRSVLKLMSNRLRGIEDEASDSEEEIALQERNPDASKIGPSILN